MNDLRTLKAAELSCDVCIVGSGPAGLTLASELAGLSLRVVVLESGGASGMSSIPNSLNTVENVGAPRQEDQRRVRNRCFGGTSLTWSGRCIELDSIDFQERPWMPQSGWPLDLQSLKPYLDRATVHLGLRSQRQASDEDAHGAGVVEEPLLERFDLRPLQWQFSRMGNSSFTEDYVRFGPRFQQLAPRSVKNIEVWTRATVTHITTDASGGRVVSLEVADANGRLIMVRPGRTVLCGGAIENARMMLASNRVHTNGIGNANDLVGRFFMDHPRVVAGRFQPHHVAYLQERYGLLRTASGYRTQRGWSLPPDVQQREGLLNCAAWATQHLANDDAWRALRGLLRPYGKTSREAASLVLRNLDQIITGTWQKLVQGRPLARRWGALELEIMVEQQPDPSSRITLSSRTDAYGVPLSRIDWKIGDLEGRTAIRLAKAIDRFMTETHGKRPLLADWVRNNRPLEAVFSDPAHPSGTTRMATSDENGVVDANCKVFGIENLYVVGSSVFPTAGHANPTLTVVALAVRLADHLKHVASPAVAFQQIAHLPIAFQRSVSTPESTIGDTVFQPER